MKQNFRRIIVRGKKIAAQKQYNIIISQALQSVCSDVPIDDAFLHNFALRMFFCDFNFFFFYENILASFGSMYFAIFIFRFSFRDFLGCKSFHSEKWAWYRLKTDFIAKITH